MPPDIGTPPASVPPSSTFSGFCREKRAPRCTEVSRSMRHLMLVVAVCVGSGLAHIGTSTMPFQIGALVDGGGRSAAQTGLFGFLEVGALAASMILVSNWVDLVAPRTIAVVGCCLAAFANLGLHSTQALYGQLLLASVAGTGYGFVFAATVSGAAGSREPDRIYAIGNGGALL